MKLRKKIYLYAKGFVLSILTAPIYTLLWVYDMAIVDPREAILREEAKGKNK